MRRHFPYSFNGRTEIMHLANSWAKLSWLSVLFIFLYRKPFHVNALQKITDRILKYHNINSYKDPKIKYQIYTKCEFANNCKLKSYDIVTERCLVRVQKGVCETSKEHLLQVS